MIPRWNQNSLPIRRVHKRITAVHYNYFWDFYGRLSICPGQWKKSCRMGEFTQGLQSNLLGSYQLGSEYSRELVWVAGKQCIWAVSESGWAIPSWLDEELTAVGFPPGTNRNGIVWRRLLPLGGKNSIWYDNLLQTCSVAEQYDAIKTIQSRQGILFIVLIQTL